MPDATPNGLLARGGEMKGRCQTPECWRNVTFNTQDWVARGYGEASIHELTRTYRCGRIGCRLHFDEFYSSGLPLQTYVGGPETAVIACEGCKRVASLSVEKLLKRLPRTGAGDGDTGCNSFARSIKSPCRHYGATRWSSEIRSLPYDARQSSPTGR